MRKHDGIRNLSLSQILMSFVFFSFFSPVLVLAQGQQPMVLIDFENVPGASIPDNGNFGPPLQVSSATFSGGQVVHGGWFSADPTTVYWAFAAPLLPTSDLPCDAPLHLQINFGQKVSNFSALLLNGDTYPVTLTICDDQGGQQQITLPELGAGTISLPDSGISQVMISGGDDFAIDNVRFRPTDPVFLDPVESGFVSGGPQVTNNPALLASGGVVVKSIAADGVTQAVVRIPANHPGESLHVSVQDESGHQSDVQSGGLFALGGSPQPGVQALDVTADNDPNKPMAFVIYLAPTNFARNSGNDNDNNSSSRAITLQVQSNDDPNYHLTVNQSIIRPPVILVHGLWSSAADWGPSDSFLPLSGLWVRPVDYYWPMLQVTSTYPASNVTQIPGSALGFHYNAVVVDKYIRENIAFFRTENNAAAVTADVVAHSMGGNIVRTEALQPWFATDDTYGHGPIDKLITIGTPHLGSPLATDLLQSANSCVRDELATNGNASFITVMTSQGPANGGVGDLQGDGVPNGFLSSALWDLAHAPHPPFRMALISATEGADNLAGVDCDWPNNQCQAAQLRDWCGHIQRNPLALDLTSTKWEQNVFGALPGEYVSDSVVPLTSQLDGGFAGPNIPTLRGFIHSPGLTSLNFLPPTELDQRSGVPGQVVVLLNEAPTGDGGDFH